MTRTSPFLFSSDPALLTLNAGSFSFVFYIKIPSPGSAIDGTTVVSGPGYAVTLTSNGSLKFTIFNSSGNTSLTTTEPLVTGWNFVAVIYDATNDVLTLFLNGDTNVTGFSHPAATGGTANFQMGDDARADSQSVSAAFGLDSFSVWGRAITPAQISLLFNSGNGSSYPFLGGAFNLVFQGNLINDPQKPVVLGSSNSLWYVAEGFDSVNRKYLATLTPLFVGNIASLGYNWYAENFADKILFAQHDNRAQYWLPPLPATALDIPGLPVTDAMWDGVTVFANHAMLWKDDRLKWSDLNDFSTWIPVSTTAVSAVLSTSAPFIQPPVGGNVTVSIVNPVAAVKSISLDGDLTFPNTNVGSSSEAILIIENSGTTDLTVTGLSLPAGFSGSFSGVIPTGQSVPVTITFSPTAAISYDGAVTVASDATEGTSSFPVTGTGIGTTKIILLSGFLAFGNTRIGQSVASSLIITNTGNTTMNVSGVTAPTGFTVGTVPSTVGAGASVAVPITFSPTLATTYNGIITVTSDATAGANTISVTGNGVASYGGFPAIFLTDNGTCQFGNVPTGTTVTTGVLTIRNDSTSPLTVLGITLPTGFGGSFSGTVAAGGSQNVTITFSPTSAVAYGGNLTVSVSGVVDGLNIITVSGTGTATGKVISLSGSLNFGDVPVNGSVVGLLKIQNIGTTTLTVSSISYPTGFSGAYAGSISPGDTKFVIVTFAPTSATTYSGNLTVNSDATVPAATFAVSGTGVTQPSPTQLAAGQFVELTDTRNGITYYNFYEVVSMSDTNIVLTLQDLTGATPSGDSIATGSQFFTVDANEAGETVIAGAKQNGPIYRVIPQGDYAYSYKERSIQSIQYTGLGNGTFFVHNEISGEGLIARDAVCDRNDGFMVLLGHKELYLYAGGPQLTPVCQQHTKQLYAELDRSRLEAIRVFHNENKKEIWVVYPIVGSFRVLIWNYVEDSASIDDYDASTQFTGLGVVDWSSDIIWGLLPDNEFWEGLADNVTWNSLETGSIDHVPLLASLDGNIRIHGLVYNRDGAGYVSISESMDFDFKAPDFYKYVDVVVLGLDVKSPDNVPRTMYVQVGQQQSLSGADIVWTDPQPVLVNGQAPSPVKVNPGGAGKYLRVRFTSSDPDVQWRISSFEIHCRPGGLY